MKNNHIHPTFDKILKREDKERLLNQRSIVIWITGLSGSGKTTIAKGLELELHKRGYLTKLLDGDNVRTGINIIMRIMPETIKITKFAFMKASVQKFY